MSIEIMNRVWDHSQQQGTKLVLLLALADMANNSGYCWPSLETLQQRARLSHRQNVIKAIAEMEEIGEVWVERNRGRNHSNNYIVTAGMSADELASTLTNNFDYTPTEAIDKANEFLKRSPQTTLSKRSPQTQNVVDESHLNQENVVKELHFDEENVVVGLIKCSPQTTRSVIEPIINNIPAQPSEKPVGKKQKKETAEQKEDPEQSKWFSALCWLVYGHQDYKLLSKTDCIAVGKTAKQLRELNYTIDELREWYRDKWSIEWPGKQQGKAEIQKPSLKQIKTGIGQVKAKAIHVNGFGQDTAVNKSISVVRELER